MSTLPPPLDDGFVLIDGQLWTPEDVTRTVAKKFRSDGRVMPSLTRRYYESYGLACLHDATTPSFSDFRSHGALKKRKLDK